MAFPTVVDRNVQYPNRVSLTEISAGVYDVAAAPGTVVAAGTDINKALFDAIGAALAAMWPVGSVFTHTVNTNPSTFIGGTWEAYGSGQCMFGVNAGDADFHEAGHTGGSKDAVVLSHTHSYNYYYNKGNIAAAGTGAGNGIWNQTAVTPPQSGDASIASADTGNQNLPPYTTVYFFRRTA
jgi:hypothetical protein